MPLPVKLLTLKMKFPSADGGVAEEIEFNEADELDISVKTSKNVIIIQNTCEISIAGLRQDIRERLLSAFTAWNFRKAPAANYVQVEIFAGYGSKSGAVPETRVFIGDVVKCTVSDSVPNATANITAFTRQIDRSNLVQATFPVSATFKELVNIVGKAAGLTVDCDTTYDGQRPVHNFGVFQINPTGAPMRFNVQAALGGLWALYPDHIAVWVDDDQLIARDIGKVIGNARPVVTLFVESPPVWTEWGIEFKTFFNTSLRLGGSVTIIDTVNTGANGDFVITSLSYELAPRQGQFYVSVKASPPGQSGS